MTLLVRHPEGNEAERRYIYDVILRKFLGLELEWIAEARKDVRIELPESDDRYLTIADVFMQLPWLDETSLPRIPLQTWTASDVADIPQPLPVLYGKPFCSLNDRAIHLEIDIFGSCFFMLSRYEEAVRHERDRHGRFPSTESVASLGDFIDRPIVNEYTEVLWSCLARLWPNLRRRSREFRMIATCDVDSPITCWARKPASTLRRMTKSLLEEHSLGRGLAALKLHLQHRRGFYDLDPNMTFNWMLEQCETAGVTATFYFICDHSSPAYDGCYRIDEPFIRRLLGRIHAAGHQLGVHGSYNSYCSSSQLRKEVCLMKKVLSEEHIDQEIIDGRQHYLRWQTPTTARSIVEAGLARDSTLGFAERAGFRCGTCYEYPLYDVGARRPLLLLERPLISMEQSVISPIYMGLGHSDDAVLALLNLKRTCRFFGGDFVLLWHNSSLASPREREMYQAVLND